MVWEGHGAKFPCPHPFPSEDVDGGTEVTVDLGTAMRVEGFVVLHFGIALQVTRDAVLNGASGSPVVFDQTWCSG